MKYVWSHKQNKHKMNGGVNLHTYSIEKYYTSFYVITS